MQRPHYLAFGLVGYLAALGSMAYFAGFLANALVPKSVDSLKASAAGSPGRALAVDLALLLAFATVHSLLARRQVKERLRAVCPPELERSLYSLVAGLQMGLLFWAWQPLPLPVWEVPADAAWRLLRLGLWALQGAGWGIVLAALATIGSTHLFGLRQAWCGARSAPYLAPKFEIRGLYRRVRHPVYSGSLIAMWSTPQMSQGRLLLVGILSLYLFVGLAFEERDLEREFGDAYRAHRRQVPSLFPRLMK